MWNLFKKRKEERNYTSVDSQQWKKLIFGRSYDDTGEIVDKESATSVVALKACIDVISETVASLSLHVYKNTDEARERAKSHPLYHLLHNSPNPEMTSFTWVESLFRRLLLDGQSFEYIERKGGRPVSLWPLHNCRAHRQNGQLLYRVKVGNELLDLGPADVLHLVDSSTDGINGCSRIQTAARSIGIAIGSEKFAAKYFKQGTVTNLALEFPETLNPEQLAGIREQYAERHSGADNAHNLMLLQGGAKAHVLNLSAENSQLIERLKLSAVDMCRLFKVPPHMIGILEAGASFASVEHQGISFYRNTIRPHLVKLEQEFNRKLFLEAEKGTYYAEFDVASLLRGDQAAQDASHSAGLTHGWYSLNEVRKQRNLPPIVGGDVHRTPLNMGEIAPQPKENEPQQPENQPSDSENQRQNSLQTHTDTASEGEKREKTTDFQTLKPLIKAQFERLITKESKAIERKLSLSDEEFRAWATEFYEKHWETTQQVLTPVLKSLGRETEIDEQTTRYLKQQFREVTAASDRKEAVEGWQFSKAAEVTEQLCKTII